MFTIFDVINAVQVLNNDFKKHLLTCELVTHYVEADLYPIILI